METFFTIDERICKPNPHPYRMRLVFAGLSHGLKTCHRHVFLTAFRVHSHTKKEDAFWRPLFWCERWDSNPHGVTTRTSNVLVYHSNTLANAWLLYSGGGDLSTIFFCTELEKFRQNFV